MNKDGALHLMMLLPVVFLFVFHYIQLFGIIIAFQDYNPAKGFFGSEFVGLQNFKELFVTPGFVDSVWNTVIIALGKIILGIVVPVTVALLLNEMRKMRVKKAVQTLIYLPHFVSWVLLAGIIIEIMNPQNGLLNQFLGLFGVEPIFFLGSNSYFRPIIWITDIWKEFGWSSIIYFAAIAGLDPSLAEAAEVDGANRFQRIWNVTIPGIMPTIVLQLILRVGGIMEAGFGQVFAMYNPTVYESGDIIGTYVYRIGLGKMDFGMGTAVGLFNSVIAFILVISSNMAAKKMSGKSIW